MMAETGLAKAREEQKAMRTTMATWLEKAGPSIERRLAKRFTSAEFIASVMSECEKNLQLYKCAPLTVLGGAYEIASVGLHLGSALGQAYLVPFWNSRKSVHEAQVILGYKGLISLAVLGGQVLSVSGRVVYENETHAFVEADPDTGRQRLYHVALPPSERGEPIAVYARIEKCGDIQTFNWLWWEEALTLRAAAEKKTKGRGTPWTTHTDQMAIKTAIRRELKLCRLSPDAMRAVSMDELAESGIDQGLTEAGQSLIDDVDVLDGPSAVIVQPEGDDGKA